MLSLQIERKKARNSYDDNLDVLINGKVVKSFKCNSQPAGADPLPEGRGMVALGTWRYKAGIHGISKPPSRRYSAFVQASPIMVRRANGRGGWRVAEKAEYSFNIHRGGVNGVSSLGCITLPPSVWEAFKSFVYNYLHDNDQKSFNVTIYNEGDLPNEVEAFNLPGKTFKYFIYRGLVNNVPTREQIPYVRMIGDYGVAKVRLTIGQILKVDPTTLEFSWKNDNEDLFYNESKIEDVDIEGFENVTWGYIKDIAVAVDATVRIQGTDVTIYPKGVI
jgi:hypothetical protein